VGPCSVLEATNFGNGLRTSAHSSFSCVQNAARPS
jgi:hypothetical protein